MQKINPNDPLFGSTANKVKQEIVAKTIKNPVSSKALKQVLVGSFDQEPFTALMNSSDRVCIPTFTK